VYKRKMKEKFINWYAAQIEESDDITDSPIDLCTSLIKPLHAAWLIDVHADLTAHGEEVVKSGFNASGISHALEICPEELISTASPPSSDSDVEMIRE
jgi:hypothetical protein